MFTTTYDRDETYTAETLEDLRAELLASASVSEGVPSDELPPEALAWVERGMQRAVEVSSLEDLLSAIRVVSPESVDMSSLPTFGGEAPSDTSRVWSWDSERLLVGTCASDMRIVDRASED